MSPDKNGKTKPRHGNGFRFPAAEQTPPQPLATTAIAEQATNKAAATLSLIEKRLALQKAQQDLQTERLFSTMAAINSTLPAIGAAVGDANSNMQNLANVIIQRGCDIAEDFVEIIINDE